MKTHLAVVAALAGLLGSAAAGAQVRNDGLAVRPVTGTVTPASETPPAATGGSTASRPTRQTGPARALQAGRVSSSFAGFPHAKLVHLSDTAGVPGLGFDFPHLAAISGGLNNGAGSHFGRHDRPSQGWFVPILFTGLSYYSASFLNDPNAEDPDQQQLSPQQPQADDGVAEQPVPEQQAAPQSSEAVTPSVLPADSPAQPDVPDVGDFVFVRRDGRLLFASVFSIVGTQLRYVTPDGVRRTLSMADLDAGATQQMNEARGTTLQFPL